MTRPVPAALLDLAAECEAAEEPSELLDWRIADALGDAPKVGEGPWEWGPCYDLTAIGHPRLPGELSRSTDHEGRVSEHWSAPAYTASLDAKLPGEDVGCWDIVGPRRKTGRWSASLERYKPLRNYEATARTEPLARRAAALRAMAGDAA